MNVDAVVVARSRCTTPVGGVPMLVRAVRTVLAAVAGPVTVLVSPDERDAVREACPGLPVNVVPLGTHIGQRADPAPGDALLVHDAARPLTPSTLVTDLLSAASRLAEPWDAVVPVLPVTDTVKLVDADDLITATPDRTGLRVLQTPLLVRRSLVGATVDPLRMVAGLAAHGAVHTVPGDPLAFPVRTDWDLELAELLAAGIIAG
jgi:2-C-methyl-D-erythritol 4-phosphate cytidylyltransferase